MTFTGSINPVTVSFTLAVYASSANNLGTATLTNAIPQVGVFSFRTAAISAPKDNQAHVIQLFSKEPSLDPVQYRQRIEIAAAVDAIEWHNMISNAISAVISAALQSTPAPNGSPSQHSGGWYMMRRDATAPLSEKLALPQNGHLRAALGFIQSTLGLTAEQLDSLQTHVGSISRDTLQDLTRADIDSASKVLVQKLAMTLRDIERRGIDILKFSHVSDNVASKEEIRTIALWRQEIAKIKEAIRILGFLNRHFEGNSRLGDFGIKYEGYRWRITSVPSSLDDAQRHLRSAQSTISEMKRHIDWDYIRHAAQQIAFRETTATLSGIGEMATGIYDNLPLIRAGIKPLDQSLVDNIFYVLPQYYDAENPGAIFGSDFSAPNQNEGVLQKWTVGGRSKAWLDHQLDSLRALKVAMNERDVIMMPICLAYDRQAAFPEGKAAVQDAWNNLQSIREKSGPKNDMLLALAGRRVLSELHRYYYGAENSGNLAEFYQFLLEMTYTDPKFGFHRVHLGDGMLQACIESSSDDDIGIWAFMWPLQKALEVDPQFLDRQDSELTASPISYRPPADKTYRKIVRENYLEFMNSLAGGKDREGENPEQFKAAVLLLRIWHKAVAPNSSWSDFWRAFLNSERELEDTLRSYHREHVAWSESLRDESGIAKARDIILAHTADKDRAAVMAFQERFYNYVQATAWHSRSNSGNWIMGGDGNSPLPDAISKEALGILYDISHQGGLFGDTPPQDVREFRAFMQTHSKEVQEALLNEGIILDDAWLARMISDAGFQFDLSSIMLKSAPDESKVHPEELEP